MTPGPIGAHPPARPPGDDDRVTPIGARRTSVADLQREVERLSAALELAETRRQTAERTLAGVASMAAADAADLRVRLAELQARLDGAPPTPGAEVGGSVSPTRGRTRLQALRRLLLLSGLVIGIALLADGILTIVWQEPITALQQSRDQATLRTDLQGLQQTLADGRAGPISRETSAARIRRQALTLLQAKRPDGSALGSVDIPRIGLKTVFVESTDPNALKKGPGHYRGTVLPGLYGTVGIAGHRTTYGAPFRRVDELSAGSRIVLRMPYGRFTYKVTGKRITTPSDASALVSHAGSRRLVLTACHPLYSAAKRIVVSARLVSATRA